MTTLGIGRKQSAPTLPVCQSSSAFVAPGTLLIKKNTDCRYTGLLEDFKASSDAITS